MGRLEWDEVVHVVVIIQTSILKYIVKDFLLAVEYIFFLVLELRWCTFTSLQCPSTLYLFRCDWWVYGEALLKPDVCSCLWPHVGCGFIVSQSSTSSPVRKSADLKIICWNVQLLIYKANKKMNDLISGDERTMKVHGSHRALGWEVEDWLSNTPLLQEPIHSSLDHRTVIPCLRLTV